MTEGEPIEGIEIPDGQFTTHLTNALRRIEERMIINLSSSSVAADFRQAMVGQALRRMQDSVVPTERDQE